MFEGQPKGLYALALANTGERFGYYTMLAVFALFLRAKFGLDAGWAGEIFSDFLMLVYFLPIVGGFMADKFGFGKMVTIGIIIMFLGYLLLSLPFEGLTDAVTQANPDGFSLKELSGTHPEVITALVVMILALVMIALGTGLFKGNLQVMVGNLYEDSAYASKRDAGFSIFYMAINIGALFAPTAAIRIMEWGQKSLGMSVNSSYHLAFAVACVSLIVSIIIYYSFRSTFRHTEGAVRTKSAESGDKVDDMPAAETKARIIALCLVFAVVIFFWMAFHQNGLSLTYFANEFTEKSAEGIHTLPFDVWNLVAVIILVYALFAVFQSKTSKAKGIAGAVSAVSVAYLVWQFVNATGTIEINAPIFQQFNPFYVVALTPVSIALFAYLANKGKEPSAPRKIAYGMLVAAIAFILMIFASQGLQTPKEQAAAMGPLASPYWLISVYLVLTFGELLLSPMGISFVSKVAPPKYKGLMMGGWFVATAIGNKLVAVSGYLWGDIPLWVVWTVFIVLCLLSAIFMFAIMKRLEAVAK